LFFLLLAPGCDRSRRAKRIARFVYRSISLWPKRTGLELIFLTGSARRPVLGARDFSALPGGSRSRTGTARAIFLGIVACCFDSSATGQRSVGLFLLRPDLLILKNRRFFLKSLKFNGIGQARF
jgi:hypothetical protein